jgi:hypothetical protein
MEMVGTSPFKQLKTVCSYKQPRGMADKLTLEERNQGWERICTYKQWLLQNVFKEGTIVILPIDEGKPNSRENPPP